MVGNRFADKPKINVGNKNRHFKKQIDGFMPETYYLLSWIIDHDELKAFPYLISLADELSCELRWAEIIGSGRTKEGYSTLEIVVYIPTHEATTTFFQKLNSKTRFTNWKPISEKIYDSVSHYRYNETPTLQQVAGTLPFNSLIDEIWESSSFNLKLKEALRSGHLLYFCFDWIIPYPFVTSSSSSEFHYAFPNSALGNVMDAAAKLGIGREVRSVKSIENDKGLLGKRMIVRALAEKEVEQFRHQISTFDTYNWKQVDEQVFLNRSALINTDLVNLYYSLQRKSRFNSKLSSSA